MKLEKLVEAYENNKIDKRLYWDLLREKLTALDEIHQLLKSNFECNYITISKDGIILNFDDDINLLFDFSQKICRSEFILGKTERESFDFLDKIINEIDNFKLLSNSKDTCEEVKIIDIGANVGRVSLHFAKYHKSAVIYALEPVKTTFCWLERNLSLNKNNNIKPFNFGCYNSNEDLTFYVPIENEAASARPIEDDYYIKNDKEEKVQKIVCKVKTLDSFVDEQEIDSVDFIKVDTEGAEKYVFEGAVKVLEKFKPIVYTEMLRKHAARFSYHPNEIIKMFKSLGYSAYIIINNKLCYFEEMDDSTQETNFLFLHNKVHSYILDKYKI